MILGCNNIKQHISNQSSRDNMIIKNYHATNESRRDDMILDVIIKLCNNQQTQNGWHYSRMV